MLLSKMTWEDVEETIKKTKLAILPVGSTEQHGPHLPVSADARAATAIAEAVAKKVRCLVLPSIHYGVSYHHDDFPGTISLSSETLTTLIIDIAEALGKQGLEKLLIINGHGGNTAALTAACEKINRQGLIKAFSLDWWRLIKKEELDFEETTELHAGERETSIHLKINPELVKFEKAVRNGETDMSKEEIGTLLSQEAIKTKDISKSGVIGDPTKASAKKGAKLKELAVQKIIDFINKI